jgi:hypothetical protein
MDKQTLVALIAVAGLVLGCETTSKPDPAMAGGAGGGTGQGTGGSGGVGGGSGGDSGPAGSAGGRTDAAARADRAGDTTRDSAAPSDGARGGSNAPIIGRTKFEPGSPCPASCTELFSQYSEAFQAGSSCTPGEPNACSNRARSSLSFCGDCAYWVGDTRQMADLAARYDRECAGCRVGEVTGRCHPTVCSTLEIPTCMPLASGGGTCLNQQRERPCPAGIANDQACDPAIHDYCYLNGRGGPACACERNSRRWLCPR